MNCSAYVSLCLFVLVACSCQNQIAIDKLEVASLDNIAHYQKESTSFTGLVFRDSLSFRLEEFSVVSGKRNGNYFLYHPNGQIKTQSIYLDGLLNGLDEHFSAIGTRTSLFNFSAGKKSGNQYTYYPSGAIKEILFFDKGVLKGENVFYYEDGKIRQRMQFNQLGQRSGTWTKFYSNGVLKERIVFEQGKVVSPLQRYDSDGQLMP